MGLAPLLLEVGSEIGAARISAGCGDQGKRHEKKCDDLTAA